MSKYALCIGINTFPQLAGATLRGCVNDANAMARYWRSQGYAVTLLLDADATRQHILDTLASLAPLSGGVVLTVASHGVQVRDSSGDEPDGLDEALVCADTGVAGGDYTNVIRDDGLDAALARFACPVEVLLDTCHSGTATRALGAPGSQHRAMPRLVAPLPVSPRRWLRRTWRAWRRPRALWPRTLWSACRDSEKAADVAGPPPHGAFTDAWLSAIATTRPPAREHLAHVTALLRKRGLTQTPQLEVL